MLLDLWCDFANPFPSWSCCTYISALNQAIFCLGFCSSQRESSSSLWWSPAKRKSKRNTWYTYSMLSVIGISYAVLTWLSQTLWMPVYPLCVLAEAFAVYQSLPYFESFGTYSTKLPFDLSIYFPYVLKIYLMMLFVGMYFTCSHLCSERRDVLKVFPIKKKKMWSTAFWCDIRKNRL